MYLLLALLSLVLFALLLLRIWDEREERIEMARLKALQPQSPALYDPSMIAGLPEPAQRFFNFAILPGTPLFTVAEIHMGGEFSLGSRDNPNYQHMRAKQILAAPSGFIWKLRLPGVVPVSGSDTGQWTRFRIFGLLPVARMGGNFDHSRAAYGRYIAEALFWTPAALLPAPGIIWKKVNGNIARVTVTQNDLSQAIDVFVDNDGRPIEIYFMRWSNANPEKIHRLQPFGGKFSDFREVQGFRLPFSVEAGNMYNTDKYFPFFKAEVVSILFQRPGP